MTIFRRTLSVYPVLAVLLIAVNSGCAPKKYISASGKELVLKTEAANQTGGIDSSVASRCLEGNAEIYSKLFGGTYNPCVELGIFLVNNKLPEEGIPLMEKGLAVSGSYNADESILKTEDLGVMQNTQLANFLFDVCMNKKVRNISTGADITADVCNKAGQLFEKIKYRQNALTMYRKRCELSGKCDELKKLESKKD